MCVFVCVCLCVFIKSCVCVCFPCFDFIWYLGTYCVYKHPVVCSVCFVNVTQVYFSDKSTCTHTHIHSQKYTQGSSVYMYGHCIYQGTCYRDAHGSTGCGMQILARGQLDRENEHLSYSRPVSARSLYTPRLNLEEYIVTRPPLRSPCVKNLVV